MNDLCIGRPFTTLPSADINLGTTSTAEKVFVTAATAGGNNPVASQAIQMFFPSNSQLAGTAPSSGFNAAFTSGNAGSDTRMARFRLLVFGRVITGTTSTFIARLGWSTTISRTGTNSVAPISTLRIGDTGSVSLATLTTNWNIEAFCNYDAVSQRINGYYDGCVHTTLQARAALLNSITSVDGTTSGQTLGFVVTGQFGTGNAGNFAYLDGLFLILD